jgi:hypothetical protein
MTVTKEADMGKKADKGTRPATAAGAGEAADVPERWSAPRKSELVMRLLRGRRWSESWNRSSLEHFDKKWALDEDERRLGQIEWRTDYRHEVLRLPVATKHLRRLLGWRLGGLAGRYIVVPAENAVTNLLAPDPRSSGSRGERRAG